MKFDVFWAKVKVQCGKFKAVCVQLFTKLKKNPKVLAAVVSALSVVVVGVPLIVWAALSSTPGSSGNLGGSSDISSSGSSGGASDISGEQPHVHSYAATYTIKATCTEQGYTMYSCPCGEHYEGDYVEKLGHEYGEWINEKSATCTEVGIKGHYSCKICKKDFDAYKKEITDLIISAGHNYIDGVCSKCGEKKVSKGLTYSLRNGYYEVTGIGTCTDTNIVIPSMYANKPIKSIGYGAFYYCNNLTGITIPNSVISIGSSAFYYCNNLTGITIPNSVISIGSSAFYYCSSLTSITIPNSVTSIGSKAFSGCSSLEEITIPFVGEKAGKASNDTYQYPFGYIFGTDAYTGGRAIEQHYYGYSSSSTTKTIYYIPSSLKKVTITGGNILYGAFYDCDSLTSVEILDGVTSIEFSAFRNCSSLTEMTLPFVGNTKTGTESGQFAYIFGGYNDSDDKSYVPTSLKKVTITSATSIGDKAFYWCKSLTSIEIPDSVTSIGDDAFYDCDSLKYNTLNGVNYLGNENNPYHAVISVVSKKLSSYTLNGKVKVIAGGAFQYCSSLTSIVIPDGVTSIGDHAFSRCSSLTSIVIPDSVTSIGDKAFYWCKSLTSIVIPDSVTSIGKGAFYECYSLTSITFNGTKVQWNAIEKGTGWNYDTGYYTGSYKVYCTDGTIEK